jgi:hypothetical protein
MEKNVAKRICGCSWMCRRESAAKASFDAHPHAFEVGSNHQSRGRCGADVDRHDDAAAGRGVAAVQADFFVLVDGWTSSYGTLSGQGGKLRFSRDFADRPRRS